jgi:hypothetical protein
MHACKILLSTRVLRAESITLWPHQSEGEAPITHLCKGWVNCVLVTPPFPFSRCLIILEFVTV